MTEPLFFVLPHARFKNGERWDVSFHRPKVERKGRYEMVRLGEITRLEKGRTITKEGARQGDIPVIAGGQSSAYSHDESTHEGETITISASGAYAGFVWYHNCPIWASDCTVLKPARQDISVKFIYFALKGLQGEIYSLRKGAAQPHVYPKDIAELPIPLPPLEVQKALAEDMSRAMEKKVALEEEAKRLKTSIQAYLEEELGLEALKQEEAAPLHFALKASELKNQRWDVFFHRPKEARKGKYEMVELGELIIEMSGGATPRLGESRGEAYSENGVPFLRVQNITAEGIKLDDVKYITLETHEGELKRSQLKAQDVVLTITGRLGSVAVVPENFIGNINQHSVRINIDRKRLLPSFCAMYFNSPKVQETIVSFATGGTRPALDYSAVRALPLPLPPLPVQERIARECSRRMKESQRLEAEAAQLLKEARAHFESAIWEE